jgi:Big-like domain-containing protein/hemolysin type calcium-binding protein
MKGRWVRLLTIAFAALAIAASAVAAAGVSRADGASAQSGERRVIFGTQGPDVLWGTPGDDLICGLGGNDRIDSLAGNDLVFGGAGNDRVVLGDGGDQVRGGPGDDVVFGGPGRDLLDGERDNDVLYGGVGDDGLVGRAGNDRLLGGAGNDKLGGREGNDTLYGGSGRDFLSGGGDADRSFGEGGNDVLHGGPGRDRLAGGVGNDKLDAGGGAHNVLLGQQGSDVFEARNGLPDLLVGGAGFDRARVDGLLDVVQLLEAVVRGAGHGPGGGKALAPRIGPEPAIAVWTAARARDVNTLDVADLVPVSPDRPLTESQIMAVCRASDEFVPRPAAVPTKTATPEDTPVSLGLTGQTPLLATLHFLLGQPQRGTATIPGPASCTTTPDAGGGASCSVTARYTPNADFYGADVFGFTVDDRKATSAPGAATVDVTEVNDPPVTAPDTFAGGEDKPAEISAADLLANDRPGPANESAQKLVVRSVATNGDSHGSATLADDKITYTPEAGFAGAAAITYTACDDGTTAGRADPRCSDGTIGINVGPNRPPTATEQHVTTAEDSSLGITLTGDDPDGDALSFAVGEQPSNGTLSGTGPNLTYAPARDFNGSDSFTFTARDKKGVSAPARVRIDVTEVNDTPKAKADDFAAGVAESTVIPGALVLWNDLAGPANEAGQTLEVGGVATTPDSHGAVGLADGSIVYTPDEGFSGTATIGYTLCDKGTTNARPDPLCDSHGSVTLFVTPADRPPVVDPQQL